MNVQEKMYAHAFDQEPFHCRRSLVYEMDFGRFAPATPGRLLDFGCGMGHFLAYADQAGWEVFGVDLSANTVRNAREIFKVNAVCGGIEQAEHFGTRFDCITLWNVLDHVGEPVPILQRLHALLADGGKLIIRVLNRRSRVSLYQMAALLRLRKAMHLLGIYHELFFSARSLGSVLNRVGFSNVKVGNSFPALDIGYGINANPLFLSLLHAACEMIFFCSLRSIRVSPSLLAVAEKPLGKVHSQSMRGG